MNNQKKIKIGMLYEYLTELHEDIKKFREGCTSDIYDSLSLSLEFECMGLLSKIKWINMMKYKFTKKTLNAVHYWLKALTLKDEKEYEICIKEVKKKATKQHNLL